MKKSEIIIRFYILHSTQSNQNQSNFSIKEFRLDNSYIVSNKKGIDNGRKLDMNTTHVYIPFWCFYYKVHLSLPSGKDIL